MFFITYTNKKLKAKKYCSPCSVVCNNAVHDLLFLFRLQSNIAFNKAISGKQTNEEQTDKRRNPTLHSGFQWGPKKKDESSERQFQPEIVSHPLGLHCNTNEKSFLGKGLLRIRFSLR